MKAKPEDVGIVLSPLPRPASAASHPSEPAAGASHRGKHRRGRRGIANPEASDATGLDFLFAQEGGAMDLYSALGEYFLSAVIDMDGCVTSVNDRYCALTKFRRAELIGWDWRLLCASLQSAECYEEIQESLASGSVWRGDLDLLVKQGGPLWCTTIIVPCFDAHHRPVRYVAFGIDVTRQKRIEQDLHEMMRLQHLLADISARFLALPTAQVDSAIESTQRSIAEALDLDRSSLWKCVEHGTRLILTHSWQRPGFGPALPADVAAVVQFPWTMGRLLNGESVCFSSIDELPIAALNDVQAYRELGTKSYVGFPLVSGGETFGALTFSTLQSERQWQPEMINELRLVAQLIGNVVSRQRAEQREEQLREELAHAMRVASIGEMASALAHELNQPLAAILSNAQAAQRFLADGVINCEELNAILNDIVRDDKRAGGVIHSMRAMICKRTADREPCSLNELVSEVLDLLRGEMAVERIAVRHSLATDLPPVMIARVELQQVLVNLLMNAIHAMQQNRPHDRRVEIATLTEEDAVIVSVRDHGPGIDRERMKSIFQPFVSTKREGLGMGLTICRRIVESHAGHIEVENHREGGANFRIVLPRRCATLDRTKV